MNQTYAASQNMQIPNAGVPLPQPNPSRRVLCIFCKRNYVSYRLGRLPKKCNECLKRRYFTEIFGSTMDLKLIGELIKIHMKRHRCIVCGRERMTEGNNRYKICVKCNKVLEQHYDETMKRRKEKIKEYCASK